MAVRTALLTSRNINLDTDFSKYIESVSTAGVITGFQVTASSVATGQARVPCIRTNLETIYAFVQNYNSISISGDGYVIISIPQEIVDNGGGNEDGTGIATVEVVDTLPAKNYLLLATITGGVVEDNRYMIPKVDELKTDIDTINEQIHDLDVRVDRLENLDAIDHLEERALVGEKYALTDTLFKQLTPALADCTVEANVGYDAATTEIHIQRQGSGTASNTLKLKLKKAGSPANLVVEVRKGVQVDVSTSEAYWYGDSEQVLATGSIDASDVTTSWQELEVTLDANFGGTEGELLDIVVMNGDSASVDASNYYVIACDSTQWSEAFSYVKVNGTTRSREKLMPYCVSGGFAQALLSKVSSAAYPVNSINNYNINITLGAASYTTITNNTFSTSSTIKIYLEYSSGTRANEGRFYITNNYQGADAITDNSGTQMLCYQGAIYTGIYTVPANSSLYVRAYSGGYSNNMKGVIIIAEDFIYKKGNNSGKPRELKDISQKASITLFGVHINNKRIGDEETFIKSTYGWQFDFCKSKGTLHSSSNLASYTAVGYGRVQYAFNSIQVSINNNVIITNKNYDTQGVFFFKPGDILKTAGTFGTAGVFSIYDYY